MPTERKSNSWSCSSISGRHLILFHTSTSMNAWWSYDNLSAKEKKRKDIWSLHWLDIHFLHKIVTRVIEISHFQFTLPNLSYFIAFQTLLFNIKTFSESLINFHYWFYSPIWQNIPANIEHYRANLQLNIYELVL